MSIAKKIKILKNIPTIAVRDKSLTKAFETYFLLKHHYDNGIVTNITKNARNIAKICQISERTLWTRISLLKSYKLAKKIPGGISLASWDDIAKKFKIKKYFYYVNYEKIVQLELVLEAKALLESKKGMQAAYKLKVNKNPELKNDLIRISGSKEFSRRAVLRCAMQAFTNPELYTTQEIEILNAYNSEDNLKYYCADDNLNCFSIAQMFNNRKCAASGSYTKQKLAKAGLITYEHRKIESSQRVRKTNLGCIYYSRTTKQTILIMPDNVEII